MKKFLIILIVLTGLLAAAAGIVYLVVPRETLLAKVTPEIGNFRVAGTSIGLQYTTIQVLADVRSKAIPVFVDSISYDIRIGGEQVTEGRQKFTSDSRQGNLQVLAIPVKLSHDQTRKLIRLKRNSNAPLEARIQAFCDLPLVGRKRFDIYKDLDVPIPDIPGLEFL